MQCEAGCAFMFGANASTAAASHPSNFSSVGHDCERRRPAHWRCGRAELLLTRGGAGPLEATMIHGP